MIFFVSGLVPLYRKAIDPATPINAGSGALEILHRRLKGRSGISGQALVMPESMRNSELQRQAAGLGIERFFFADEKVVEKPVSLRQQRWGIEDDSGCEEWVGAAFALPLEKMRWSEVIIVPLENLLVDANAVQKSLRLYFQEGFEICFSTERQPGANWTIISAEVLKALALNHDDLMWARGGLAWALRKPLYPFNVGFYHCPRTRARINVDLRLNRHCTFEVFKRTVDSEFSSPAFSYERWLDESGWEQKYCDQQPETIVVEPSAMCQASCLGCPHNGMDRRQGLMPVGTFKKILESLDVSESRWVFSGCGEPLLNPALSDMISEVSRAPVMLVTSLQRMPAEGFCFSGIDQLRISVDALESQGFEANRPGCSWKNVEAFIADSAVRKAASPDYFPELGVTMVRHSKTEEMILPFLNYWKKVAKPVFSELYFKWPFDIAPDKMQWFQILGENSFLGKIEKTGKIDFTPVKRRVCRHAVLSTTILWDGSVTLCPFDTEGRMAIGNVNRQSLIDIWQSNLARQFRKAHLQHDFAAASPFCRDCRDWYHNL